MPKLGILTGGGDCPGLNPAIRGVVLRAAEAGIECLGLKGGWKGMIEADARAVSPSDVAEIINKGGTILGTTRTNPFQSDGGVEKVLETFKKLELDALVVLGGEDTLGVAAKLYEQHKSPVIGVPKTMDNDLSATDYTFGFDTSVTIAVDAAERLRDTGRSHGRVMILEVMGRHAGWVSLFTGIASAADYVCLPERPVDVADMVEKVTAAHAARQTALVIASEAIELPGEKEDKDVDEFGHTILQGRGVGARLTAILERETGLEVRAAVIGHIQRGGPPTLFDVVLATRVGVKATELVIAGDFGKVVALKGDTIVGVSLKEATARLKTVPEGWLKLLDTLTAKTSSLEEAAV